MGQRACLVFCLHPGEPLLEPSVPSVFCGPRDAFPRLSGHRLPYHLRLSKSTPMYRVFTHASGCISLPNASMPFFAGWNCVRKRRRRRRSCLSSGRDVWDDVALFALLFLESDLTTFSLSPFFLCFFLSPLFRFVPFVSVSFF